MSAEINKIPHINSFTPLFQYTHAGEQSLKPLNTETPSVDPFNSLLQSHASLLANKKKLTIYLDEESIDEEDYIIVAKKTKSDIPLTESKERESKEGNTPTFKCESILTRRSKNKIKKDHIVTFCCSESDLCHCNENDSKLSQSDKPSGDDSNGSSKSNRSSTKPTHPSEIWKTFLAALLLLITFYINLLALSIVHDNVPKRSDGPLPDAVLNFVSIYKQGLFVSEYIIMFSMFSSITSILLFHKYSSIVFRRTFLMLSILYFYRTITMSVTVLPIASSSYKCAPKIKHPNVTEILRRSISLIPNFGLSVIGPQEFCGDLIYSGHTVLLVLIALIMSEYTSKKLWLIHWIYRFLAFFGILMLELAHAHYLIDVIIAYYITTRVFWTYQTLANNENLKTVDENNCFSRAWWFNIFLYFEKNIHGPVPNECQWLFDSDETGSGKSISSQYGAF